MQLRYSVQGEASHSSIVNGANASGSVRRNLATAAAYCAARDRTGDEMSQSCG